jgi:sugar (pentulose or hexulose) kinase
VALLDLSAAERATLAALYGAQVTAWLVDRLGGLGPVVVEGPFAHNPVYTQVLAQLCGPAPVFTSTDTLEGTARGAWMLTHWTEPGISPAATARVQPAEMPGLQALHQRWLAGLAAA